MSFLKGASEGGGGGGDENKNKFEKLIPIKRDEIYSQVQTKEFPWGVCNDDMGHN